MLRRLSVAFFRNLVLLPVLLPALATAQTINCHVVVSDNTSGSLLDGQRVPIPRGQFLHQYEDAPNFFVCYFRGQLTTLERESIVSIEHARDHFLAAVESDPTADDLAILGKILVHLHDLEGGRQRGLEGYEQDEDHIPSMLVIAKSWSKQRDYDQCRKWFQRVLDLDPDNAEALVLQAINHYFEDDSDKAVEVMQRALELEPDHSTWHANQGLFLNKQGTESFRDCFDLAVQLDPANWHAWSCKSSFCEDPDQALEYLKRAFDCGPNTYRPAWLLARRAEERGADREAFRLKNLAVRYPDCPDSYKNRHAFDLATNPADEFRDGTRALEIARQLIDQPETYGGRSLQYHKTLAAALAETGKFEEALDSLDHCTGSGFHDDEIDRMYEAFEEGQPYRSGY